MARNDSVKGNFHYNKVEKMNKNQIIRFLKISAGNFIIKKLS